MEATGSVLQGPYSEGQASSSLLITTRLLGRNWRSERRKCSRVAVRLRSQIQHFPLPPARIRSGFQNLLRQSRGRPGCHYHASPVSGQDEEQEMFRSGR